MKIDGFVKSRRKLISVIPVTLVLDLIRKRESSVFNWLCRTWIPACAHRGVVPYGTESGMTTFYEFIKIFTLINNKIKDSLLQRRFFLNP